MVHQTSAHSTQPGSCPGPIQEDSHVVNPKLGMGVMRSTILLSSRAMLAWRWSLEASRSLALKKGFVRLQGFLKLACFVGGIGVVERRFRLSSCRKRAHAPTQRQHQMPKVLVHAFQLLSVMSANSSKRDCSASKSPEEAP